MRQEIERKFLVTDPVWEGNSFPSSRIRQGYFSRGEGYSLRIRMIDDRALLTIKGKANGISRSEFEYEIPAEDGEAMLREFCQGRMIEKRRYFIPFGGFTWEVDQYFGANQGLITAEIELESEETPFQSPPWLGKDVSDDPRYTNQNLAECPHTS